MDADLRAAFDRARRSRPTWGDVQSISETVAIYLKDVFCSRWRQTRGGGNFVANKLAHISRITKKGSLRRLNL